MTFLLPLGIKGLNFLNNDIPHETMICDDKDPPRFNSWIKSLIENKKKIRKNYQRFKSNSQLLSQVNLPQEQLYLLIIHSFFIRTIL